MKKQTKFNYFLVILFFCLPVMFISVQNCGDDTGGTILLTNADLENITITGAVIEPDFSADVLSYTAEVEYEVESVSITLPANSFHATYTINGTALEADTPVTINLDVGENIITVVVTAEDGITQKTYTLTITRYEEELACLDGITLTGADIDPDFSADVPLYAGEVEYEVDSVSITLPANDCNSTYTVNDEPLEPDMAKTINLDVGENTITVVVISDRGNVEKTYIITITRLLEPTAPTAANVIITGTAEVGETLTGIYTYLDANGDAEATSAFRWLICDTEEGTYTEITGATSLAYDIQLADELKYIKFEVTPVADKEPYTGTTVLSDAALIPRHPRLYFTANDGNGREIWMYDGYNAPQMVAETVAGPGGSKIFRMTVINDKLYFIVKNSADDTEIWEYDFESNPDQITNLNGSDQYLRSGLTDFNDKVTAIGWDNFLSSLIIIEYDGSSVSTDYFPIFDQRAYAKKAAIYNDRLYFSAGSSLGSMGYELTYYDGTTVHEAVELNLSGNGIGPGYSHSTMGVYDSKLYFCGYSSSSIGFEPYSWNGFTAVNVADINSGGHSTPAQFIEYNDSLYFTAFTTSGVELYEYDGSSIMFNDIMTGSSSSNPGRLKVALNKLFFQADNGNGREMFMIDDTGALYPFDLYSGASGSYPRGFIEYMGKVYFRAKDSSHGQEVWCYDGINTPELAFDISPGNSRPRSFVIR